MRTAVALSCIGALLIPVIACARPAPVEAGFRYGTLQLTFAQPMQTWDNLRDATPLRFEPALQAQCAWASDTELSCDFDDHASPAPATRYRIDLEAGLKTQAGDTLPAQRLVVETERPTVGAVVEQWQDGWPDIVVTGSNDTTAREVAAVLRLQVAGRTVAVPALQALPKRYEWDSQPRYRLRLPPVDTADAQIVLSVVPGLKSNRGPLRGTQRATLLRALGNERFRLRSVACAGREASSRALPEAGVLDLRCTPGEPLQFNFSKAPAQATAAAWTQALPTGVRWLHWRTEPSWNGSEATRLAPSQVAELQVDAANHDVALAMDGLRAGDDGAPIEPAVVRIHTGDYRPMLTAAHAEAVIADGRSPPLLVEARNAPPATFAVRGVGAGMHSETVATPARRSNRTLALPSTATTATLAEGGWVRWTPSASIHAGYPVPLEFAAPAFDLFAVVGRRQVLAWANAWDEDRPVAGAGVELLWLDAADAQPRVIARATTAGDGTALLTLPDDLFTTPDDARNPPMWLLRATRGRLQHVERAVLPVGPVSRWGLRLGRAAEIRTWGVADRPLYRAGDTVHYHLWQREEDAGRLLRLRRSTPLSLQLFDLDESKTILEWQAVPQPDGSVSGQLVLPTHLADANYCIGTGNDSGDGSCFFVGTYRAQDLWAEAKTEDRVLRDGDRFDFEIDAGYYSGGAAAGLTVNRVTTMLTGLPVSVAYPQFGDYEFIDVMSDDARDGIPVSGADALQLVTDAQGSAHGTLPVSFASPDPERVVELPAFGRLQLVAELKLSDREATASNAASARYSRYPAFVGLRTEPEWLDASTPVRLAGVVIDAGGRVIDGVPIEVEVAYLAGFDRSDAAPEILTRCRLTTRNPSDCDFPRARSGRYRLIARSGSAAPVEMTRYVWVADGVAPAAGTRTQLQLLQAPSRPGDPVRLLLTQPHERARALLVYAAGDRLLGHRVEAISGNAQPLALRTNPDWRAQVTLTAYVRGDTPAAVKDGYREPAALDSASLRLPEAAAPSTVPVTVAFDAPAARPGERVHVVVRNHTAGPRDVVLAVVDDGLRALAGDVLAYFDPHGQFWLGAGGGYSDGQNQTASFANWNRNAWTLPLPWPPTTADAESERATSADQPGHAAVIPAPAEPPVVFDEPSPIDVVTGSATSLDRVVVTGSRIALADIFVPGATPSHGLRPREQSRAMQALARVRTHFADSALWEPGIHLAAGESRRIELTLPDNLTRWRALAWSSDADDDFALAETTIEAGLPLEVRLQAPVRIYPADQARIAANVRSTAEVASLAQVELRGEGLGADLSHAQALPLASRGQSSFALELNPVGAGTLQVTATAETPRARDAVASAVEVASPYIAGRRLQAGWLGAAPLALTLPVLPTGASEPQLTVGVLRGDAGLVERWTEDLRVYPHRCWEQILSRAVAAALAIERDGGAHWPDARAVVQEALDNVAVFQGEDGDFRYFAEMPRAADTWGEVKPQVALTAYSLRALALLGELGYAVPAQVETDARAFLAQAAGDAAQPDAAAFAAAALPQAPAAALAGVWKQWPRLTLAARIAAARALLHAGHAAGPDALQRLLALAPARGPRRTLHSSESLDRWMGSDLREQCALIELLQDYPALAQAGDRRALVAGLADLYAGGSPSVDTQEGVYCLLALRGNAATDAATPLAVDLDVGGGVTRLQLPAGTDRAEWKGPAPASPIVRLAPVTQGTSPLGYIAELNYQEDARMARASAVGLSIQRRFEVLADGGWTPLAGHGAREGDWIRITLEVRTSAPRYFVAITDAVPGGLRPTDLALGGLAGLDLARVSDEGSRWFGTRRLDPRSPRFYAEFLPAGRHEVHYFARVANSGDYLAAPALAELMYASASSARTEAVRLQFAPAQPQAGDAKE